MIRFISICMTFLAISLIGIPVYNGISKEHKNLTNSGVSDHISKETISFEEIYAFAADIKHQQQNNSVTVKGNIDDHFPKNFTQREDAALANTVK